MVKDQEIAEATTPTDKLGCAVKALKALDGGRWDRLEGALKQCQDWARNSLLKRRVKVMQWKGNCNKSSLSSPRKKLTNKSKTFNSAKKKKCARI